MKVDGVKADHGENTGKKRGDLELRRQETGHDARKGARHRRKNKGCGNAPARHKGAGGHGRAERKGAFDREVGNVKDAKRDVDAARQQRPEQSLRNGRDKNVNHRKRCACALGKEIGSPEDGVRPSSRAMDDFQACGVFLRMVESM